MDFKEDQLAIEAHIRMRCQWRDMDEISEEEYLTHAIEYIQENPFADDVVKLPREAICYNRLTGEVDAWKRIPGTELYWEPGDFWMGMRISIQFKFYKLWPYDVNWRGLAEYFGLVNPARED